MLLLVLALQTGGCVLCCWVDARHGPAGPVPKGLWKRGREDREEKVRPLIGNVVLGSSSASLYRFPIAEHLFDRPPSLLYFSRFFHPLANVVDKRAAQTSELRASPDTTLFNRQKS
jgi:hypothetical protein